MDYLAYNSMQIELISKRDNHVQCLNASHRFTTPCRTTKGSGRAQAPPDHQPADGRRAVQLRVGRYTSDGSQSDLTPPERFAPGGAGRRGARWLRRSLVGL